MNANRHQIFVPSWCLSSLPPKLCAAAVTEVSLAAAAPLGGLAAEAPSAAAAAPSATAAAAAIVPTTVIAAARPLALPIRAALLLLPPDGLCSDDTATAAAARPAVCAPRLLLPLLVLLLLTWLPQVRQIGADVRKVATLQSDEQHRASHIGMSYWRPRCRWDRGTDGIMNLISMQQHGSRSGADLRGLASQLASQLAEITTVGQRTMSQRRQKKAP